MTDEQYAARLAELEQWTDASEETLRIERAEVEREYAAAADDADGM